MTTCEIILIVFLVLLVVFAVILIIIRFTMSSTVSQNITPTLQELQTLGQIQDDIFITDEGKPFKIQTRLLTQTLTQNQNQQKKHYNILKNCIYPFQAGPSVEPSEYSSTTTESFRTNALIGFFFHLAYPCVLIDFSVVVNRKSVKNQHLVTIFDVESGENWTYTFLKKNVTVPSYISSDAGYFFLTEKLEKPIILEANKKYAIATAVLPNDIYLTNSNSVDPLIIDNSIYKPDVYQVQYPSELEEDEKNIYRHFVSFHLRALIDTTSFKISNDRFSSKKTNQIVSAVNVEENEESLRTVFDVNLATGAFARFPPHFLNGMNITVPENGANVLISRGFALSQQNTTNMVLDLGLVINAQTGINGLDTGTLTANTWYSVYIIASVSNGGTDGLPVASLLSLGHIEPDMLPNGYEAFRRIGSVRTTSVSTIFDSMQQEGDSVSRTSFFTGDFSSHFFDSHSGPTTGYVITNLPFVPPTSSRAIIDVRTQMLGNQNDPTTPQNGVIRFRPRFSTLEGISTVGLVNQKLTYNQITVSLPESLSANPNTTPEIEFRIFAQQPGGDIPAGPFPDPLMITNFYIAGFFETL